MKRNLEETLQALYNSEINVTITMLWDGGFDFALCSYMDKLYEDMTQSGWHNVRTGAELADALHNAALQDIQKAPTPQPDALRRILCSSFQIGFQSVNNDAGLDDLPDRSISSPLHGFRKAFHAATRT